MRIAKSEDITNAVKTAFIEANLNLPEKIKTCLADSMKTETGDTAKKILLKMQENIKTACEINVPICQDTGMAIVFVRLGQDVHIDGELLSVAINRGIQRAYIDGDLRLSVVEKPVGSGRVNTNDNTPAIIHTEIVGGEKIEITCVPKGFGSENASRIKMFEPSASETDIIDFIAETVKLSGGNSCPPVVVGVGIGGDFEYSAILAKKALLRDTGSDDEFYRIMEQRALEKINSLNIGPQGLGGNTTAFAVNIETYPTHIAGLPVAVNMCCHVLRHKTVVL